MSETFSIRAGEPFDIELEGVSLDGEAQALESRRVFATCKQRLSDADEDAVSRINSVDDAERFSLEGPGGVVRVLTEAESLMLDGHAGMTLVDGAPLIRTVWWDVWFIDGDGNDLSIRQGRLQICKPVTGKRNGS